MVPVYVAAGAILAGVMRALQAGTASAWMLLAVNAAVTAASAWLVVRYIDRPLAAPATPGEAASP